MVRISILRPLAVLAFIQARLGMAAVALPSCADGCMEWCRSNFPNPTAYANCLNLASTCSGDCFTCGPQSIGGSHYLLSDFNNCGACGAPCQASQTCCYGLCHDITIDPLNCGACGNACFAGESCCNGKCVNKRCDNNNCATCGNACTGPTSTCCSSVCTDLTSSQSNCGACDATCPIGFTCCNGQCVDLTSDPNNCASCASPCSPGQVCCGSSCQGPTQNPCGCGGCPPCSSTQKCCAGKCYSQTELNRSPLNCGSCGNECGDGAQCCNGNCRDILWDPKFCGTTCANAQSCGSSQCCWGQCVNLVNGLNLAFCGACTSTCRQGGACCQGTCYDMEQLQFNNKNCGTSCSSCTGVNSVCCNGNCVDPNSFTTSQACGACGVQCGLGQCCNRQCCSGSCSPFVTSSGTSNYCSTSPCNNILNQGITPNACGSLLGYQPLYSCGGTQIDATVLSLATSFSCVCVQLVETPGHSTCLNLNLIAGAVLGLFCSSASTCTSSNACGPGKVCVSNLCCNGGGAKNICVPYGAPTGTCPVLTIDANLRGFIP